jgi:hypothetical protein
MGAKLADELAGVDTLPDKDEKVRRPNAVRNEWLYHQYAQDTEKTLKAIRREAKQKHGWSIGSDQTLRKAVKSHCKFNGIDMPTRINKRIKLI